MPQQTDIFARPFESITTSFIVSTGCYIAKSIRYAPKSPN